MRITPYGKDVFRKFYLISLILIIGGVSVTSFPFLKIIFLFAGIFILLFTVNFFRDPERKLPENADDKTVTAPADGKIVLIENLVSVQGNHFTNGNKISKVCIFMSPLNVHVNRIPISGTVESAVHIKGSFKAAFKNTTSDFNEHSEIMIKTNQGRKILLKQIAGFVARRIVYDLKEGTEVKAGDRFGMIKFGSRVDVLIEGDAEILVKEGEKAVAGETILALLK